MSQIAICLYCYSYIK